jgi:hypothetical protein
MKRHSRALRHLMLWLSASSAVAWTACRREPEPTPGTLVDQRSPGAGQVMGVPGGEPSGPGEMATARHYTMAFSLVKPCTVSELFRPPHGTLKLGVKVRITGTSELEVPVNPFYATAETADGASYPSTLAGCDPVLPPVRVALGKSAEGWITFDVPTDHKPLMMVYAPTLIGAGVEELRFRLE